MTTAGSILYLDGITVSFDGFKALNCAVPDRRAGRAPGDHRPQRRRQDDDDGRHHRQDPARQRHRHFKETHDLTRLDEAQIAQLGIGRKFQKPTVFESHTVFENLELALKAERGVMAGLLFRLNADQRARIDRVLYDDPADRAGAPAGGPAQPRPEAMARDRHAAGAGPGAAAGRRARRRHDRQRDRGDGRAAARDLAGAIRSSWSSTTWSS